MDGCVALCCVALLGTVQLCSGKCRDAKLERKWRGKESSSPERAIVSSRGLSWAIRTLVGGLVELSWAR